MIGVKTWETSASKFVREGCRRNSCFLEPEEGNRQYKNQRGDDGGCPR